ncbi:MAG: hypothetical protein J7621_10170 [Niastella sp.]|nr:hypothetical protein [Niastella sp.]
MKKIFTLAAIMISLSVASFAADRPKKGKISVTSNSPSTIFVKIDGQRYNVDRNEFVLNSIKPGNHRVEIYRMERRGLFGAMKTTMIYNSFVMVAPDQLVNLNVNRYGSVAVRKSGFDPYDRDDKWGRDRDNDHDYGRRDDDRGRGNKW